MRGLACLAIVLALLSLPFGHRGVGATQPSSALADFIAMGGTPDDLCGDTPHHVGGDCDACRIVSAMDLPSATRILRAPLARVPASVASTHLSPIRAPATARPPARAPPSV
ncbi:hypothetical protein KDD17_11745 [Sulfitobacter albidus]|uniref:Polyketide synthase n=1 Tax=Sulfitobacter albidus TaxID=2829501 RepID=A0A975JC48_9RHOB|nr:hypothetical protein [Sulfitobacter albidus]QUJ75627.1 hypothetical protein KDD17_11745 [Sulfitobacter albidus]